jgi:hypothetical protein
MAVKTAPVTLRVPHPNSRVFKKALSKKPPSINTSSGEYVRKRNPQLYERIVRMLASPDYSFHDISKATNIGWPTLRAIYERNAQPIEQQREILKRKLARTYRKLIERVEDTADHMRPRDAIFGVSVIHDKLALLSGEATSHNINLNVNAEAVNIAAQFEKLHKAIREKAAGAHSQAPGSATTQLPEITLSGPNAARIEALEGSTLDVVEDSNAEVPDSSDLAP